MTTETISPREISAPAELAEHLQATTAAVRVSFTWFGVRKTLTPDQNARAADTFGAEGEYLSAAKKLLDTRHPAFKAVTAVRTRVLSLWRGTTLPYPESGVRLIRQDRIGQFTDQMDVLREQLVEAVEALDRKYDQLCSAARQRLGSLYNSADYPSTLRGLFAFEVDFPSTEPPNYLMQLNPRLYEQQRLRMVARFEQAVQLAEDAFIGEFNKVVGHLVERLSGSDDGKPKIFRDSVVGNLHEFFERFRSLNVHSNEQLDRLVETAQNAMHGIRPDQLRDRNGLRRNIATQLSAVGSQLEGMMVDRPRRRVLRGRMPGSGT